MQQHRAFFTGLVLLQLSCCYVFGQDTTHSLKLDSIVIKTYGSKNSLLTPAAFNYISSRQLERFSNTSILQALNAQPGVKMEERSPGSYRLNIRGSSVRSPFGVRNVKIYYAGIPFTAPGGASMLNMMGYYNIGSLEVIKGPGGSLYGAGTGGVLLMEPPVDRHQFSAGITGGSFGMMGANAAVQVKHNTIRYEHLQSDGYRRHTDMRRDNLSWDGILQSSSHNTLEAHFIYSDLFYKTPGALTISEFNANARAARPGTPSLPGAEEAKASIHQQNILLGLTNHLKIADGFSNNTSIYGFHSYTKNPTVQNYERKKEPHFGGRTSFEGNWKSGGSLFTINSGAEYQQGYFDYKTYRNMGGKRDTLRIHDQLIIRQYFLFAQANWNYKKWIVSTGISINRMKLDFERWNTAAVIKEQKIFKAQLIPRFAVLYRINNSISLFTNVSKGFSPPAAEEIFADNNSYNLALAAETGWNIEPGIRGNIFNKRLGFDLSYFTTGLRNSIVTRRDAGGGNYYINAGKTSQQGLELALQYTLSNKPAAYFYGTAIKGTFSHYRFRYKQFEQAGNDYSGNDMPGVSPNNANLLLDIATRPGYYFNITYTYTDKTFLNDANTAAAKAFHILAAKAGYTTAIKKLQLSFFAGADNMADVTYSLGNDINGFGGRYYNIAPGRSLYAGFNIKW